MSTAFGFRWPRRHSQIALRRTLRPAEASPEPKGSRTREVLAFIRNEIAEGREFPRTGAIKVAMNWKAAATVDDVLLRLLAGGFIEREVVARKGTRRTFAYRLTANGAGVAHDRKERV